LNTAENASEGLARYGRVRSGSVAKSSEISLVPRLSNSASCVWVQPSAQAPASRHLIRLYIMSSYALISSTGTMSVAAVMRLPPIQSSCFVTNFK
jgi:hypothetical protein